MATEEELRRAALALDGTAEAPHFDRAAFKRARTFATLAADGRTANLKFEPDEQAHLCAARPDAYAPVPNAWGAQGWTTLDLGAVDADELEGALRLAWASAGPRRRGR